MTNLPATVRGWRGQLASIDATHRVHARAPRHLAIPATWPWTPATTAWTRIQALPHAP